MLKAKKEMCKDFKNPSRLYVVVIFQSHLELTKAVPSNFLIIS